MNANINYDEIPDTSAVQEDLLAALSSAYGRPPPRPESAKRVEPLG